MLRACEEWTLAWHKGEGKFKCERKEAQAKDPVFGERVRSLLPHCMQFGKATEVCFAFV